MSLLIMGSVVAMAAALLLVSVFRRKIVNKKVLAAVNFLIFTSAVVFEIVFVMQILKREKLNMETPQEDPYANPLASTKRYEPIYEIDGIRVNAEEVKKRIRALDSLRIEGKISSETFRKSVADIKSKEVR